VGVEQCPAQHQAESWDITDLTNPVKGKPFLLCSDASDYAVGATFKQEGKDGQWDIMAYESCSLNNTERKCLMTEKDWFAVVHFMNCWQHFLLSPVG